MSGPCGLGPQNSIQTGTYSAVKIYPDISGFICPSDNITLDWSVTESGQLVAQGEGLVQNQYFLFYAPSTPGTFTYIVTLNASCDDRACPPCTMPFTLNVIEGPPCTCSDWGWTSVSWGDGPGQFSGVQNGISIGTGTINPGTEIKIIPYDLGCNGCGFPRPNFSWSITAYGQPIADGQCLQQDLPIIFTPPDTIGQVTYVVTLGAECKDTICPQQIFSILVSMNRASTALLAPVITSFTASRTQVAPGETVMLYWTITGSGDAFLTCGGERRSVPLTGSMAVTPPQSGCCTLAVSNQCGSDQKTVCITVVSPHINGPVGGCCTNGRISQATQSQCAQIGGEWYPSLTEASQACQPPTCWCCTGGRVYQATQSQCTQMGGACYNDQSQATRACQQAPIPPRDMR